MSKKDKPWDTHKSAAADLGNLLASVPEYAEEFRKHLEKLGNTAETLGFRWADTPDGRKIKLVRAWFSQWRHDPVTAWRKALKWRALWFSAIPRIMDQHPSHRYLHLTLTVKNPEIGELKQTIRLLNASFKKMLKRKELVRFESLGWFKAVEVTRGKDGTAHPHLHVLLVVPSHYFSDGYIKHARWVELWRSCLGVDYDPGAHVQVVKAKKGGVDAAVMALGDCNPKLDPALVAGILEVAKYPVKAADLLIDVDWTAEYIRQVHRMRFIEVGGILKPFFRDETDDDDLIHIDEDGVVERDSDEKPELFFSYMMKWRRYVKEGAD